MDVDVLGTVRCGRWGLWLVDLVDAAPYGICSNIFFSNVSQSQCDDRSRTFPCWKTKGKFQNEFTQKLHLPKHSHSGTNVDLGLHVGHSSGCFRQMVRTDVPFSPSHGPSWFPTSADVMVVVTEHRRQRVAGWSWAFGRKLKVKVCTTPTWCIGYWCKDGLRWIQSL